MAEIIGPDGEKYYSSDHFEWKNDDKKSKKSKKSAKAKAKIEDALDWGTIKDYVYLIWWGIAILIWLRLLAELAVWLILLFLWSTGVNYWLMKNKE